MLFTLYHFAIFLRIITESPDSSCRVIYEPDLAFVKRIKWQQTLPIFVQHNIAEGLTLKGLRHTVATILAEMGSDDRTIADWLGQKTLAMAQHYSNRANRSKKLTKVIKKFEEEMSERHKNLSTPS